MFKAEIITWVTIFIYLCAAVFGLSGMIVKRPLWRVAGRRFAIAAFLAQTVSLAAGFHGMTPGGLSSGAYLQLLAWFLLLCGIGAWLRAKNDALLLFAAPLGLILFLASVSALRSPVPLPASMSASFYALHIGALFLSLGLICVAFIAGVLFLWVDGAIKSKRRAPEFLRDMPALTALDKINSVCVLLALPLYTLGIVAGFFWAAPVFGQNVASDPKGVTSLLVWLFLAVLFHNRLAKGWKGRKPALLAICIFIFCLFSIVVVNLALSTNHAFIGK